MIITEYRISLPLTVEEYKIGQLYSTVEMSREETGGGEGVEILKNEPFFDYPLLQDSFYEGQYTYKVYHMSSKVPAFIRHLAPRGSLEVHEEAWNSYPYCKTELRNPGFLKEGFSVSIYTHNFDDKGEQENVHCLTPELLQKRNVVYIDIVNDPLPSKLYNPDYDPIKFKSVRTGRGPLVKNWIETTEPIMTSYKLVIAEFKWFGLQSRVENLIQSAEKKLFILFHRMMVSTMDKWYGISIDELRRMENVAAKELHQRRHAGKLSGLAAVEE